MWTVLGKDVLKSLSVIDECVSNCCYLTHPIHGLFVFLRLTEEDGRDRGRDMRGPLLDGLVNVLVRGHPAGGEGPVRQAC